MFAKKRARVLLVGLLFLAMVTGFGCNNAETVEYTAADEARTIQVATGEQFKIVLDSNETTGFMWRQAENTDSKIVHKITDEYLEPNTGAIGAGGKHTWTFEGANPGETTIKLDYIRPWETEVTPEKTLTYKVTVLE